MEDSLAQSKKLLKESKWAPAYKHLEKAKPLLFNRKKYDLCGSVGEAIKDLESIARIITGEKLTLGELSAEVVAKLNLPKPPGPNYGNHQQTLGILQQEIQAWAGQIASGRF
jgi:hypothetical protein